MRRLDEWGNVDVLVELAGEVAVECIQDNADAIPVTVCYGQVWPAIAVEIGRGNTYWPRAVGKRNLVLKYAIAVA